MSSRTPRSKSKTNRPRSSRPPVEDGSQPDVQVSYTSLGQEAMVAIAEELFSVAPPPERDSADDAPELFVSETAAGRDTLALIAEAPHPARSEQTTLSYGDRISNAPGATTPSRLPAPPHVAARTPPQSSAPEIVVARGAVGRETLAAITAELVPSLRAQLAPVPASADAKAVPGSNASARAEALTIDESADEAPFAIFEMLTFVVQGPETVSLSSEALRRRFVEERLLHRLPAKSMAQVERVDVTPWTVRGTVVVRVWCKV